MNKEYDYTNFSEKNIKSLISDAKKGDKISVERLLSIIRDVAHSYFLSKYRLNKIYDPDVVDDLTNDVCMAFHQKLKEIENTENWLRKVLYFKFINYYKQSKNKQTFELNTAIQQIEEQDETIKLDAEIVLRELNKLSQEKATIIRLRFWEGLKFQEIAEQLGKSEAAIKKMFYRTIEELKEKF